MMRSQQLTPAAAKRARWRRGLFVLGLFLAASGQAANGLAQDDDEEDFSFQIFVGNADGSDMQRLIDFEDYQAHGSPDWSDDGKVIAFDAWKPQKGEKFHNGHIIVVNADGTNPRDLGKGNTPSLSPQGNRVAFSSPGGGDLERGIWVMDVANPESKANISASGWGVDWSPDGTRIAYADGANLILCNWIEGTLTPLLDGSKSKFSRVYWNFQWSSDSRQIAFKGVTAENKPVLAVVDALGEQQGLKILHEGEFQPALAWHPDKKEIVVTIDDPDCGNIPRLFSINVEHPGKPQLLPKVPADRKMGDPCFSPDGKRLAALTFKRTPKK